MPRGGPRPGAGAPTGNFNALKHGLRSRQLQQLSQEFARSPAMRAVLERFARLHARQRTALRKEVAAAVAVAAWLRYSRAHARGEPWPGPMPAPPFTYRAARLWARRLAQHAIEEGLVHQPNSEACP